MNLPKLAKKSTLTITRSRKGSVNVLHFSGDLDLRTLDQARDAVNGLLDSVTGARLQTAKGGKTPSPKRQTPPNLVIDLREVEYIDSSGLGFFIGSLKRIKESKGDLKLANLNAYMLGIFKLINMHYIIDVFDNLEKAVDSFGPANRKSPRAADRAATKE